MLLACSGVYRKELSMVRRSWFILLTLLALGTVLFGQGVLARQGETDDVLPGLVVETLGRGAVGGEGGDDLVLLRVTIGPGASVPASEGPRAALIALEVGRAAVELESGEANLKLAGGNGTVPLAPGDETTLAPGDSVSSGEGARLAVRNAGDTNATLLYAAVAAADAPLFTAASLQAASGTFSVETFACPEGMTWATLDIDACQPAPESLVTWSLASDQFDGPLGADEATVDGATTTWEGLPGGTYFVELTAESFAAGYGDYYIPSSNQVTRHGERTTRIYFNSAPPDYTIKAYVFDGD
jgi:hypothetical protein